MTRKPTGEPIDTGTAEFNRRRKVVPIKMRTSVLVRVVDSTAIDRALMNSHVDPEQHSALVAFSNDCFIASLIGPRAQDYGKPMGTGARHDIGEREAAAMQRVGRAIDHVDALCGRPVRESLMRMVLEDRDMLAADVLGAALALLEFYRGSGRPGDRHDK